MADEHQTVFISYRRSVAADYRPRRCSWICAPTATTCSWMSKASTAAKFEPIILNQIEARAHFLVILAPGTVERCAEPGDWLRREIEYAIEKQRNIVPIMVSDFTFHRDGKISDGQAGRTAALQCPQSAARIFRRGDDALAYPLPETARLRRGQARARQRSAGTCSAKSPKLLRSPIHRTGVKR